MNKKKPSSKTTTGRKFWRSLEERNLPESADWSAPENSETAHKDFADGGVNRRDFLKYMGAGAALLSAACRRPTEQIVPAVIQPPEMTPGKPLFYSTTAPDGTALIVRAREGRPLKVAGNPDHPLFQGGVSASNVASLMDLYDPDRQRSAARIVNGVQNKTKAAGVLEEAQARLRSGSYALLTGPINSPATRALIQDFLTVYPNGKHVEFRPDPTLRQIEAGQRATYGNALIPNYHFDRADYILSIDGDFLGTMVAPSYFSASFIRRRDLQNGRKTMGRFVMFESMFTVTGSNADERFPIRPGDQTTVALSLAAHLVVGLGRGRFAGDPTVRNFLQEYKPTKVAPDMNIKQGVLERIADELWKHRGNSLVLGGSPLCATGNQTHLQVAVNLLNSILGNDGSTVDYKQPMLDNAGVSDSDMQAFMEELRSGKIQTLLLHGANPVYHLPALLKVEEAIEKATYVLAMDDRMDETGRHANAILPTNHYLESWGDAQTIPGIYSVRQPLIRPLFDTASFEDYLLRLAGDKLDAGNFHRYLQQKWSRLQEQHGVSGSFRKFWQASLQSGYFAPARLDLQKRHPARSFDTRSLQTLPKASAASDGLKLGLYYNIQVLDGSGANNSYRQELPDPITKVVWENCVSILPATARKMNLVQGSIVEIQVETNKILAPVHLQPGLHPDAICIALGYGRTHAGRVANGRGVNVLQLTGVGSDSFQFSGMTVTLKDTGERHTLPNTQSIFRSGQNTEDRAFFAPAGLPNAPLRGSSQTANKYERPVLLETTLEEYLEQPGALSGKKLEYPKDVAIMSDWKYENRRWNMVVDLSRCIGCASCVTSCNTENNIPMVGPEEVSVGREMHWLRIDRYFSGSEDHPDVSHQPMLCQHCENAPCETVCPVSATTHTAEGLNSMTYNRCIGTRYCANNCPFKVRRFNYFENWHYFEGLERKIETPQHLALNPDVTVRTRGVMEKCTFCVQRISGARQEMLARGETKIRDGVIKTACQEVCPTQAISFGDINDPDSEVSKLSRGEEKRAYKVLDFLGINPSVTYLAKIRNKKKA